VLPMVALRNKLATLLAADATTLAPASLANKVQLITAPFAASENLAIANLTLASGNGLGAISCATGTQNTGADPITSAQIITLIPASGSTFRWLSSGTISPAITLYGIALTDNGSATLLGVQAFSTPIPITAAGQVVDVDPVTIKFVLQPMS